MDYISQNEKIRTPIVAFGILATLVLFQPPTIGTIFGAISILLTIFVSFSTGNVLVKSFVMNNASKSLFLFLVHVTFISFARTEVGGWYFRFASQIILFLVLSNIAINQKECDYIRQMFVGSNCVYAILIIKSCMEVTSRYYHDDITILGATFDPNFIGLSLVATTGLLLDRILYTRNKIFYLIGFVLCVFAIAFTGSRGNFVGLVIVNGLIILEFWRKRDVSILKRILIIGIVVTFIFILITILGTLFPSGWARMSQISGYSDNGRYRVWNYAIADWEEHPIFGNGFRSMLFKHDKVTHNTYLELLSETGLIGASLFLIFLFSLLNKIRRKDKTLFIVLIGMLVQIAFLDAIDNRVLWTLLTWLGMLSTNNIYLHDVYSKSKIGETQ